MDNENDILKLCEHLRNIKFPLLNEERKYMLTHLKHVASALEAISTNDLSIQKQQQEDGAIGQCLGISDDIFDMNSSLLGQIYDAQFGQENDANGVFLNTKNCTLLVNVLSGILNIPEEKYIDHATRTGMYDHD